MHKRFLKFVFGLFLIYIVAVVVITNNEILFDQEYKGQTKLIYEQKRPVDSKVIKMIISDRLNIELDAIEIYRYDDIIEISYAYINQKDYHEIMDSFRHYLPLELVDVESTRSHITGSTRFLFLAILTILSIGGIALLGISFFPSESIRSKKTLSVYKPICTRLHTLK